MKRFLALAAAAATLTLTACSSNDGPAEPEPAANTEQATGASAESTPLSQEEWVELCGPEGTAPDDPKCFEDSANPTVKVGEWGELVQTFGAGVRVGMRWSRIDERKEQEARNQPAYRDGQSVFNYKPNKKFK